MAEQQGDRAFVLVYFVDHKGKEEQRSENIPAAEVDAHLEQMMRRGYIYKGTRDALLVVPPHKILGCRISYSRHDEA